MESPLLKPKIVLADVREVDDAAGANFETVLTGRRQLVHLPQLGSRANTDDEIEDDDLSPLRRLRNRHKLTV